MFKEKNLWYLLALMLMSFSCDKEEEIQSLTLENLCTYQNKQKESITYAACATPLIGRVENVQGGEVYYTSVYNSLAVRTHVPGTIDCVVVGLICNASEDIMLLEGKKTNFSATFYESNLKGSVAGVKMYYVRDFVEKK